MRMNGAEAIMWWAERDPALRSDFTNVTIFDACPDPDLLRARIVAALDEIPRLRQRVVAPPLRIQPPEWRDAHVDIDYHFRRAALPEPRDHRALLDFAADFAADPLDRTRPLWQFVLVENLAGGRAALLQKVHHTITDGVGGLRLSLILLDPLDHRLPPEERRRESQSSTTDELVDRVTPLDAMIGATRDAVHESVHLGLRVVRAAVSTAIHPSRLPERVHEAWQLAGSLRRQVLVVEPGRSPLFAHRSLARRFETLEFEFEPLKRTAKKLDASVNDVFVAGVATALGRYHSLLNQPVASLRMAMPVDLRAHDALPGANRFAPTRVLVSTRVDDVADHVALIKRELASVKREPVLGAVDVLATLAAPFPTSVIVAALRNQAHTIDFATSNLRGSPIHLTVCGAHLMANFAFGPRTGTPLNITLFSYASRIQLGVNIDPAAVTHVPLLLECLEQAFTDLAASGEGHYL